MVLVNTKFRIMELLIMNSAGEFISAFFFLPLNAFVLFTIGNGCRGKIFSMGSHLDNS